MLVAITTSALFFSENGSTLSNIRTAPAAPDDGFPVSVAYEPSAAELEWRDHISEWHSDVCARSASPAWFSTVQSVVAALAHQDEAPERDEAPPPENFIAALAAADAAGHLSHMVYTYASGATVRVALEPLIGMLRDPRSCCDGELSTVWEPMLTGLLGPKYFWSHADQHMWVLLDPALARVARIGARKPTAALRAPRIVRAFLLDMGGSRWNHAQGSRWTIRTFARLGIHFDHSD